MNEVFEIVPGADPTFLVVVDHASNRVPADIDLRVAPEVLGKHVAWDIGASALGRALCTRLRCAGLFGNVSRLVLDLHRERDSQALIPALSDGHPIPGNDQLSEAERRARIDRFWYPYHGELARRIGATRPGLILAIHSFTARLETASGGDRPWQVGILYNQDDRAARIAMEELRRQGLTTGDNEPYSGKLLNATMNMHAEAHSIPYLAIEVRNDLISDAAGVEQWANILESVSLICRNKLARAATRF